MSASLLIYLALAAAICAAIPALIGSLNLARYRRPGVRRPAPHGPVSVLIPARDEEAGIEQAVRSVLANDEVDLEVVVMDDHSTDRTAEIVRQLAREDARVRLEMAPALPDGWCGKQHACAALAERARHPWMLFMDADVRLAPDGLVSMLSFLEDSGAALVSGIPRQVTGTWCERWVVPLIHLVLLGFLPMGRMRASTSPAFAAGCGQLFLTGVDAYREAGGHAAIRASRHDGITLPRAYRRAGLLTDLFDATEVATCRMYRGARQVWNGFAKNAVEGMAGPVAILPWTLLLGLGQVLPIPLALLAWATGDDTALALASLAILLSYGFRLRLAVRFRQPLTAVPWHPLGVALVLAIQWYAWARWMTGREIDWKGRVQIEA